MLLHHLRGKTARRQRTRSRSRPRLFEFLERRELLASLTFSTQPQSVSSGAVLAPITVSHSDAANNPITIALADNPGSGQLAGTVTRNAVNGAATFDDLVIFGGQPAGGYTLLAYSPGDDVAWSQPFEVAAGTSHLDFANTIPTTLAGENLGPVHVQLVDVNGMLVQGDNSTTVTLYLDKNPGQARFVDAAGNPLTSNPTATAQNGVAVFDNIRLDKAGIGYTLGAVTAADSRVRSATSNRFAIVPNQGVSLAFEEPPTYAVRNIPINTGGTAPPYAFVGVTVRIVDRFGNPLHSGNADVQLAIKDKPDGVILGGPTQVAANDGLARFSGVVINLPGTYQFEATAMLGGQLSETVSQPFVVLDAPSPLLKLDFLTSLSDPVPVRGLLPPIRVQVTDDNGNPLPDDNTSSVSLQPAGVLRGVTTVRAVNGVATFDKVYLEGRNLAGGSPTVTIQAQFEVLPFGIFNGPTITLTAGEAVGLAFESQPDDAVAGDYLTAGGSPLRIKVVDADGNTVTTDHATRVAIGILRNGDHSQPTFIGNGPVPGRADAGDLVSFAEAVVMNGVATFDQLYINPAGDNYQLSIGTLDLPFPGVNSSFFNIRVGQRDHLEFLAEPSFLDGNEQPVVPGSRRQIGANGTGFSGYPLKPITMAVVDRVGNRVDDDETAITLELLNAPPDGGSLQGVTTLTARDGLVFFDQVYIDQATPMTLDGYRVRATTTGLVSNQSDTGSFSINPPPSVPDLPNLSFVAGQEPAFSNGKIEFAVNVSNPNQPVNAYDQQGVVNFHLLDANDNFLFDGPFPNPGSGKNPTNGVASFSIELTSLPTSTINYKVRALFDFGARAIISDAFSVSPSAAAPSPDVAASVGSAAGPLATSAVPSHLVTEGLGSLTNSFDVVQTLDVWSKNPDGTSIPIENRAFPPSAPLAQGASEFPQLIQPNVAPAFDQVALSNDWWSSILFRRVRDPQNPERDSEDFVLYPMFTDPLATMVNSGGTFAGLGLGHLTTRYVTPTTQYLDNVALLPPGQPPSLEDPRFPGAGSFEYRYEGTHLPNRRLYQDLAIGLRDVQADAKVLRYSDWTVTFDWDGKLQATLGKGLPFAYFSASDVPAGGTVMQVATANPQKTTTITAYDLAGNPVTSGTGAVRLKLTYTVDEVDPLNPSGPPVPLTIANDYGLFLPSNVAWTLADGQLSATLTAENNYYSVAVLPDDSAATFDFFRQRAYTFVTGSTSSFSYDEASGTITTTYLLQTTQRETGADLVERPLQSLYPHQYRNLAPGTPLTDFTYESARGTMRVLDGPVFVTELSHRGTLPLVPPLPDNSTHHTDLWNNHLLPYLRTVSDNSLPDGTFDLAQMLPLPNNNYFEAQSMFGAAQLIPILRQIGASQETGLTDGDRQLANAYAERIFNVVKDRMSAWLSAGDDAGLQLLYYQPRALMETNAPPGIGWQSLMSIDQGFESSRSLNDHHLIGGYFIKTAALLAQYDSNWGDTSRRTTDGTTLAGKMGDIVNLIVKDISNYQRTQDADDRGGQSPQFPFLRNFDVYSGHSWADGAANDPKGNNQESTSEALNYASALIQWGEATGDQYLRDLGIYLYNTEIESFDTYYFNVQPTPNDPNGPFPADFRFSDPADPTKDVRPSISKLNSSGAEYGGFIGLLTSRLAGIQMLPFSGASYYLGRDTDFVLRNYAQANSNPSQVGDLPIIPPAYYTIILPYLALADPETALTQYLAQLESITLVNGINNPIDNHAFNIHWMSVLQEYGTIDTSVSADTVSYAAFIKQTGDAASRTFVAYNPTPLPRTVTFRDAAGTMLLAMEVPGRTLQVRNLAGDVETGQTSPDFSLETPQNRFFLSAQHAQPGGPLTFLHGRAGAEEQAVEIPAPGQGHGPFPTPNQPLAFELTGLTGTLQSSDAVAAFSVWLDPQFAVIGNTPPIVRARITYDPDGTGTKNVVHDYNNLPLSLNPGFVKAVSPNLINAIPPYPVELVNGKVTFEIWGYQGNDNTIRLRTDAAAEQGRVSFLDLPYAFSTIGGNPVDEIDLNEQVPATHIIDDGDARFLDSGNTTAWAQGFQGDVREFSGAGSTATYTFSRLPAGAIYDVAATWTPYFHRDTAVPFTIDGIVSSAATVHVDQTVPPDDFFADGGAWERLGAFQADASGILTVTLASTGNRSVVADAVRIDLRDDAELIVQQGSLPILHDESTVDFGAGLTGANVTRTFTISNIASGPLTLGPMLSLPAGFSRGANNRPSTLFDGNTTVILEPGESVHFDVSLDTTTPGSRNGLVSFQTNDLDEATFQFAVTGLVLSDALTVDDGDAGYADSGDATRWIQGYQGDVRELLGAASTATYTFDNLTPGEVFEVSTTWTPFHNRTSQAPYTIHGHTGGLQTVLVNQLLPPDDFTAAGAPWEKLGSFTVGPDGVLTVILAGTSSGNVIADAVRIERRNDPEIVVAQAGMNVVSGTTIVDFGRGLPGSTLSRVFTISNQGGADLILDSLLTLPDGFERGTDNDPPTIFDGIHSTTIPPGDSATFEVHVAASSLGTYRGDLSFTTNDMDEGLFTFELLAVVSNALMRPNPDTQLTATPQAM